MTDDKTDNQENNNEMENDLNEVQEQPSELEEELNKAASDENNKNTYDEFLDEEPLKEFEKAREKGINIFELIPKMADKLFYIEAMLNDNLKGLLLRTGNIQERIDDLYAWLNNSLIGIEEKIDNIETTIKGTDDNIAANLDILTTSVSGFIAQITGVMLQLRQVIESLNLIEKSKNSDLPNTDNNNVEFVFDTGITVRYLERIANEIAELKDKFTGLQAAPKTRAKRKKKETPTAGGKRGRGVNKVGTKRIGRPPKKTSANVSHKKRGIKKRSPGRPAKTTRRKSRRS